jgi:hypothetical protein
MKKLILINLLLLATINTFSKCGAEGLSFWPNKNTISENSIFVIEGYATSQEIINKLGKSHKVYLKSGKEKIELKIQQVYSGQFNLTQAILKPSSQLSIDETYELIIENITQEVYRYSETNQKEKVTWKVVSKADNAAPKWLNKPVYKGGSYLPMGCGPSIFVKFNCVATDESEYLIETIVRNNATGAETTYCLNIDDNELKVGHGMCSGAFVLNGDEKYTIEFVLLDASGNTTKWAENPIEFVGPKDIRH